MRLGPAIDHLLKRHDYPEPVSRLVGEAVALAALLGSTLKLEGRFQLQTKSDGPVNMLLVDFDAPSNLRALARFDRDADRARRRRARTCSAQGHMAFTIDPGGDMTRYQGVIALEGQSLEAGRAPLFRALGADPDAGPPRGRRDRRARRRAPGAPAASSSSTCRPRRRRRADFHPGDAPEGIEPDGSTRTTPGRRPRRARRHDRGA